jgi:uncharacterized protein (TIGR03089 family)
MTKIFPTVLAEALRTDPGRPFVTFYDEATGERVELSLATYANWVAKASGLLVDEHGLERGQALRIELPPHWLSTVFLGAAWNVGLAVTDDNDADAVVCGPNTVAARAADGVLTLACSLRPLGGRFADPLPDGVHDVGVEIWAQPDAFAPWDPPAPADVATRWAGVETTQAELWAAAAGGAVPGAGGSRLLSEADPASPPGTASLSGPLATSGSLVLVAHADPADPDRLAALAAAERVTDRFPRADERS